MRRLSRKIHNSAKNGSVSHERNRIDFRAWDTLPTKATAKKRVSHEEKSRGSCMGHAGFAANRRLTRRVQNVVILQPIVPSSPLQLLENIRFAVEKKYPLHGQLDYMFLQYYQIFPLRNPRTGCVSVPRRTSSKISSLGVPAGHMIFALCQRYLCVSQGDVKVAYQKSFLSGEVEPRSPAAMFQA